MQSGTNTIGVNDDDLLCESAWPPLSSVRVDFSQVGYLAARQLDRMLNGEPIPAAERWLEVAPAGVAACQSTAVLAVDEPHVATAIAYIRDHACDPCRVDEVVAQAPVNRRWLERQFMRTLGRTIHGQITQARMQMAIRLLSDSDDTLEQISGRCGYTEVQHFCRAFRQNQGVPPGAFRRSQRERA
ncbi:MAG: helix-turn-helix domain-containing protein [Phycisphaerae bacterium]